MLLRNVIPGNVGIKYFFDVIFRFRPLVCTQIVDILIKELLKGQALLTFTISAFVGVAFVLLASGLITRPQGCVLPNLSRGQG